MIRSLSHLQRLLVENPNRDWKEYGDVVVKHYDDLTLFHYSRKCVMLDNWDFFHSVSRGLILNNKTGEIVARPFDKFHNYQPPKYAPSHKDKLLFFTEKVDGSMGIGYWHKGEYHITTKGALDSVQGQWATEWFHINCKSVNISPTMTPIFEITYPDNRIVIPYEYQGLTLIGVRNKETGAYIPPTHKNFLALADVLGIPAVKTYARLELDAISQEMDKEGYVSWWSDGRNYSLFKHKTLWYITLHRLVGKNDDDVTATEGFANLVEKVNQAVQALGWNGDKNNREERKVIALRIQEDYREIAGMLFAVIFNGATVEKAVLDAWK